MTTREIDRESFEKAKQLFVSGEINRIEVIMSPLSRHK